MDKISQFLKPLKRALFVTPLCAGLLISASFSDNKQLQAQEYTQMTLSQAIARGVKTNPEYGVVSASRRATDEEFRQARGLYYPSVDMRLDGGYEHSDDPATRSGLGSDHENMWRYDSSLTLTQLLFDGHETDYEIDRQKKRVQSSAHRVRETAELVGLAVVESFLEVMRQRELLYIARQNVNDHIKILEKITDGANAGRSTQADVEQAKARVASTKAQEANVLQQVQIAESNFLREVGAQPKDLVMPNIPYAALAADVEEEVKQSLAQSPTLDIFKADIDVALAEYEGTKGVFYPQIDFQANARQGHNLNGVRGRDRSASALFVMNWNLYRGGIDSARVREFTHRHHQTKEEYAEASRAVEDDVRQTWARMVTASERAQQFAAQAEANFEVVQAYQDQFELDRRTLLDVLDSQNELFVSRSNAINARFLEIFSLYRLLALKGQLFSTVNVVYPNESVTISN